MKASPGSTISVYVSGSRRIDALTAKKAGQRKRVSMLRSRSKDLLVKQSFIGRLLRARPLCHLNVISWLLY